MERDEISEWLDAWIDRYANGSMRRMKAEVSMMLVDFQATLGGFATKESDAIEHQPTTPKRSTSRAFEAHAKHIHAA